ncbi:MAG: zinc carboxypeptidase [Crocinitomicaceae bacterium]|nr:zinc carboxypeptidase [Crocinitomicaceae bacterium]
MLKSSLFLTAFLAATICYSQGLKSPSDYLGYELGSYYSRHHQVVDYFEDLEENSNGMLQYTKYGETNEHRELTLAYISTKENLTNLEAIKTAHENGEDEKVAIVWLGYNVHGNEPSGTETSMQTAYELLTEHQDWLKDVIVIIDPCLNPDGRDRYVNWYNQKKNANYDPNVNSAEHDEAWPSGRFNHYLFDLNRDWSWLTQVETQQRIKIYNQWMPHVHVDFHEQGHNSPYYFAPGAEPMHEVISDWQKEFQNDLGRNHAKYFDANGWLYYTKEIFDLLYPGYGDTYPTFNGAIGMTYEQAGHTQGGLGVITSEGPELSLKDRIAHHHTTGISTVEFSVLNKQKLITEFNNFVSRDDYKYKTYAISGDEEKIESLIELLDAQQIKYTFGNGITIKGFDYQTREKGSVKATESHLLISALQRKGGLVTALFEPSTLLSDSMTYDITAWSLPYAYGLNCIASESEVVGSSSKKEFQASKVSDKVYAYLIPWSSFSDAQVLSDLLGAGVKVRFADEPFSFGDKNYVEGTLIIITKENDGTNVGKAVAETCLKHKVLFETTTTGMVDSGFDFGSSHVSLIKSPTVGMISGETVEATEAGQVWHFFEQDLNYPVTVLNVDAISTETLKDLDVLILPEGWYSLPDSLIANWVMNGGNLIAIAGAVSYLRESDDLSIVEREKPEPTDEDKYKNAHAVHSENDRKNLTKRIPGALYKCKVDPTHPLAFGYTDNYISLKIGAAAYELLEKGGNVVYLDEDAEPISGFAGAKAQIAQKNTLIFGVEEAGSGSVIYMVDNPLFRGFWQNGKLFFANAIFFVNN